jgi:hypothetical protein
MSKEKSKEKMMIEVHAIRGVKEYVPEKYVPILDSFSQNKKVSWGAKALVVECLAYSNIESDDSYIHDFSEHKLGRRKAPSFIKECIEQGYAYMHKYTEGKIRKKKLFLSDSKEEIDSVKKNIQKNQSKS